MFIANVSALFWCHFQRTEKTHANYILVLIEMKSKNSMFSKKSKKKVCLVKKVSLFSKKVKKSVAYCIACSLPMSDVNYGPTVSRLSGLNI